MNAKATCKLHDFIRCEKLDDNLFRGESMDFDTGQVYGGQVLGQAVRAASRTVEKHRHARSAHAYFLLKGDVDAPIIYHVDRSFDGGSISSRRVVASQHGRQILHLSASFQTAEQGLDFQNTFESPIETLPNSDNLTSAISNHFQSQFLDTYYLNDEETKEKNTLQIWIKTKEKLPDDPAIHRAVLAYISDMGLLHSTLVPHNLHRNLRPGKGNLIMASIDHAIWFHRSFRADEWFLYHCQPISTNAGRGLSHGSLYSPEGILFASTSQEGMVRLKKD